MRYTVTIPADTSDPAVAFLGTDEEIEAAEAMQQANRDAWKAIVESPGFQALRFLRNDETGQYCILHPSTRCDDGWQLSFGDKIGPVMHEEYSKTSDWIHTDKFCGRPVERLYFELTRLSKDGAEVEVLAQDRVQELKQKHNERKDRDGKSHRKTRYHGRET